MTFRIAEAREIAWTPLQGFMEARGDSSLSLSLSEIQLCYPCCPVSELPVEPESTVRMFSTVFGASLSLAEYPTPTSIPGATRAKPSPVFECRALAPVTGHHEATVSEARTSVINQKTDFWATLTWRFLLVLVVVLKRLLLM